MITTARRQELSDMLLELVEARERYRTEGDDALVMKIRDELADWAYGLSQASVLSAEERDALIWGLHVRARQVALRLRIG